MFTMYYMNIAMVMDYVFMGFEWADCIIQEGQG